MISKVKERWFQRIENMHPYQMLVYLGMIGSGIIFLFMLIAFIASKSVYSFSGFFNVPKSFILSTFFLVISGYSSSKMLPHYLLNDIEKLKKSLFTTLLFGILFTLLQFLGWKELASMGLDFKGIPSGSYIYVLSGIHLVHLAGAMFFATTLMMNLRACEKDEVKRLLLFTNPYERMKIELFATYWKFMDIVWVVLFFSLAWAV